MNFTEGRPQVLRTAALRTFARAIVADPRLRAAAALRDRAQFEFAFDDLLQEQFPGLKPEAVRSTLGNAHDDAYEAFLRHQAPEGTARTRRDERATLIVGAAVRLLPPRQRNRWAEEWTAEWHDMAGAPRLARVAFLARLLLRSGPALAWVLRVHRRREAA
ncbi:hypothetical protein ACFVU3_37460 [Streptomyces sp. NPDC058052]|uniref:hypothetical protein n=1 Tax=Streptomyces sp. NPDC058052 TaxID=3346316 RepID=UPI0036E33619